MSDTTQATLVTDADEQNATDEPMNSDDTIDDEGLLAKVRNCDHPAVRCGYCQEVVLKGYKRSAHGRRYCPECQTVKASDQRDRVIMPWWEK